MGRRTANEAECVRSDSDGVAVRDDETVSVGMRVRRVEAERRPAREGAAVNACSSILVIDEQAWAVQSLCRILDGRGYRVSRAETFQAAREAIGSTRPAYVVSELRVGGRSLFEYLAELTDIVPIGRVVIATVYPSVATAVRLVRMGVAGYLTKPISDAALADALRGNDRSVVAPTDESLAWPSLDRTIWEYLSQVHVAAGSLSKAAVRLGLDRRSLRRMLARQPPAR